MGLENRIIFNVHLLFSRPSPDLPLWHCAEGHPALPPRGPWPGVRGDGTGLVSCNSDKGDLKHADPRVLERPEGEAGRDGPEGHRPEGSSWAPKRQRGVGCGQTGESVFSGWSVKAVISR